METNCIFVLPIKRRNEFDDILIRLFPFSSLSFGKCIQSPSLLLLLFLNGKEGDEEGSPRKNETYKNLLLNDSLFVLLPKLCILYTLYSTLSLSLSPFFAVCISLSVHSSFSFSHFRVNKESPLFPIPLPLFPSSKIVCRVIQVVLSTKCIPVLSYFLLGYKRGSRNRTFHSRTNIFKEREKGKPLMETLSPYRFSLFPPSPTLHHSSPSSFFPFPKNHQRICQEMHYQDILFSLSSFPYLSSSSYSLSLEGWDDDEDREQQNEEWRKGKVDQIQHFSVFFIPASVYIQSDRFNQCPLPLYNSVSWEKEWK